MCDASSAVVCFPTQVRDRKVKMMFKVGEGEGRGGAGEEALINQVEIKDL